MRILYIVLIALLFAPAAAAMGGEPLSEENNTLWNQYTNEPECCTTWASTDKGDPAFSGSGNYGTGGSAPPWDTSSFTWEWPLEPELDRTVYLDPEGSIESTIHIRNAADLGTVDVGNPAAIFGYGSIEVTLLLTLGDDVVAQGEAVEVEYFEEGVYEEVSWSLEPMITELDPAVGNLVWSITASGSYSGLYVSHTDANGNGWLTLPIIGVSGGDPEPVTLFQPLDGPAVKHEFTTASSDIYIHNFTGELEAGQFGIAGNGTGNLTVTLTDHAGTVLAEGAFSGEFAEAFEFQDAVPGDWNLTLDFNGYNGTVAAAVTPSQTGEDGQGDGSTDEGGDETGAAAAPAGNETVEDEEGSIPAPGMVPVGVLLLSAVAAVRAHRARRD